MKNKLFFIIFHLFVITNTASLLFAAETVFGYVNCENLIRLHPLMKQYDPATKRFINTASEPRPSEEPAAFIKRLSEEQKKIATLINQLDAEYGQKISGKSLAAQKLWWVFWKRRESFKVQYDLISEAISQARLHGDFFLNTPSPWTMFPVLKAVSNSINDALEHLKANKKLQIILDTSVFLPFSSNFIQSDDFVANRHHDLWQGKTVSKNELFYTSLAIKESIVKNFPALSHKPFLAGATDLTKESEMLLQTITLRSPYLKELKEDLKEE
ncbi:MAG: hypothetical protein WDA26_08740 [Pusillimonas sp.]